MKAQVEVTLADDGGMSITGTHGGKPMEVADILQCLEIAVEAVSSLGSEETLQ